MTRQTHGYARTLLQRALDSIGPGWLTFVGALEPHDLRLLHALYYIGRDSIDDKAELAAFVDSMLEYFSRSDDAETKKLTEVSAGTIRSAFEQALGYADAVDERRTRFACYVPVGMLAAQ